MIGIYMFGAALALLALGYPVAFSFGAVSILFGAIAAYYEIVVDGFTLAFFMEEFLSMFSMMPFRIYGIMTNKILLAVPLFIFMGIVLQKSHLAQRLLEAMGTLFGNIRGGVAVSTILVGTMLAASTGVVGASVVAMGVISLPVMLKYGYNKPLACGTICASGTLGQIIPPSIILIILADVFAVPVGDLFQAAVIPSLILVGSYIAYVLIISYLNPTIAPAIIDENNDNKSKKIIKALKAIIPPITLIVIVLGSIFAGIATPTESASVGAVGALVLALLYKEFSINMMMEAARETVKVTAMVFAILIGATAFSLVFVYTGADGIVEDFMLGLPGEKWGFIILSMLIILFLGFFIDFIEISYIVVPILLPISQTIGIDPIWFAILIAMNLQTSFLTPPFGFSLFYLKGVAKNIKTTDIYKGVIPFILIQIVVLITIVVFPNIYGF
ncbi:MAG: TRAP transporter large permease subunit [Campylobacteraceae bacterium]|jgi:tripartite ATP-independent transporter DctM subunit|nr:TRAP transporter large permease subunit [Campylobacteraceae bacterium]MBT3882765.1 TRAP transporter large permease subunit [Campylobacteraceae bacterium]MBT4030087.1 TRAP transporter large permease subunit [Campylobacteraceae bacterium]MBT4572641.1 TRAP transporter large permease subunit [Campylobacteraceae bacterium]MBT5324209.1 TRAP transporter large permease subunit [Campylobacteraceae bacterium]